MFNHSVNPSLRGSFFGRSASLIGLLIALPVVCLAAVPAWTLEALDPPASVIRSSPAYEVREIVPASGREGFLIFRVHSPHADYEVEGFVPLVKLLHEIAVIERIRVHKDGSGFFDGFADSVAATGSGFIRLVSRPGDSMQGIGSAIGKLGGRIGGMFQGKEAGEKIPWGEKMLGASERELAKKFGVDVYTRNPYMKELLRRMAKSRLSGKGAAAVGKILIPVGALVSVAVTASGVNGAADNFVNDSHRGDLYEANVKALTAMGFPHNRVRQFLNLSYYTPRETTYIRFYLETLRKVDGFDEIFEYARQAMTDHEAQKALLAAQVAADYQAEFRSLKSLRCFEEGIAADDGRRILFFAPYDYLDRSALGDRLLRRTAEIKQIWRRSEAEIINGGKVTPAFIAQARTGRDRTLDWVLLI